MTEALTSDQGVPAPPPLLRLLELGRQARHTATGTELQFLLVNRTFSLFPYLLAVYWVAGEGVVAQSGVSNIDRNAPFVQWLSNVFSRLPLHTGSIRITPDLLAPDDIAEWGNYLPASAIWLPLARAGTANAGLMLCRQEPWEDHEIALLTEWLDMWAHAWKKLYAPTAQGELRQFFRSLAPWWPLSTKAETAAALEPSGDPGNHESSGPAAGLRQAVGRMWTGKKRWLRWMLALVLVVPVRLTVLAPAELVPAHPAMIRVPIEGVVDEFFVVPNQAVVAGQPLFRLDLTTLTSRLKIAQQEIQVADSEYRQGELQSLTDAKSRTQLTSQEAKTTERKLEVDYLKELLSQAQIKAPRAGVVLFDDPSEWIGKPVIAGEKVMTIATEGDVEIEAWLPVSDAIELPAETSVTLYLNATPLHPVSGQLRYVGHEALQRPDGSYAFRLRAKLPAGELARRVGLRGTAKISGEFVPLVYWVLRKPVGTVRQLVGI